MPTYTGKYAEVKVKDVIRYDREGRNICIYGILFAPIYNQKTVIGGIKLSSIEYGDDVKKFYYGPNDVYSSLNKSNYTYNTIDEIVAERYQFFLEDNRIMYSYSLTEEQFESCLTNIKITITINGYDDEIDLKDLVIHDYSAEVDNDNKIIARMLSGSSPFVSLSAYVEY